MLRADGSVVVDGEVTRVGVETAVLGVLQKVADRGGSDGVTAAAVDSWISASLGS